MLIGDVRVHADRALVVPARAQQHRAVCGQPRRLGRDLGTQCVKRYGVARVCFAPYDRTMFVNLQGNGLTFAIRGPVRLVIARRARENGAEPSEREVSLGSNTDCDSIDQRTPVPDRYIEPPGATSHTRWEPAPMCNARPG
jgi:hypothetical protein